MRATPRRPIHTAIFLACLAVTAGVYSYTIFSNFCMDQDTLNYVTSPELLKGDASFLKCIGMKGWFAKFHLFMFSLVYLFTKAYSFWGGWDFLAGFKICTLVCSILTIALLYFICKNAMQRFYIAMVISFIPLCVLGYSWLITTCDDNPLANFFNLLFLASLLIATGAVAPKKRESHCYLWALITGLTAGLSLASHLKNIVALPIILALIAVKPPHRRSRLGIAAAGFLGLALTFGLMYWIYWIQSAGEPVASKIDFWVFHRVPGRFYLTPPRSPLTTQAALAFAGIRSSLYTFQELVINTDLFDEDVLGYVVVGLFFAIYFTSIVKTWRSRAVKILFFLFLCDAGHSFLYDTWVVERWDSFTLPVFITIGIYWDNITRDAARTKFQKVRISGLLLIFFGALVWFNVRNTRLLIGITDNHIACRPSAKKWPYHSIFYFYFDHRGVYNLAGKMDGFLTDGAWFLSPKFMQGPHPHVYGILDQYLTLYSKKYRNHLIENPNMIGVLANQGRLKRLVYIDTIKVPIYIGTAHSLIVFDPATTKTVYENDQFVVKEAVFNPPPPSPGAQTAARRDTPPGGNAPLSGRISSP